MTGIFLHVRTGFEEDASKELSDFLARIGASNPSYLSGSETGFIYADVHLNDIHQVRRKIRFRELIFARQLILIAAKLKLPQTGDRISGITDAIVKSVLPISEANAFSSLSFETPDEDKAKMLSKLCKSLTSPLERQLNKLKLLPKGRGAAHLPRIHIVMLNESDILIGFSDVENSSPWPMGIPRLRFPNDAPSRSTLKLEEAFHLFLGASEMHEKLTPHMTAVDLGACPGGWTYQLVKHGLVVTAIDNGSIAESLMATGKVYHLTEDAFRYRPEGHVNWLVCDIVEQPMKVSKLMLEWVLHQFCDHMIFNLKLPMKKRFEECRLCLDFIQDECNRASIPIKIIAKQLYHDRKEITVYLSRL